MPHGFIADCGKAMRHFSTLFVIAASLLILLVLFGCAQTSSSDPVDKESQAVLIGNTTNSPGFSLSDVPPYAGKPFIEVRGNEPSFSENDLSRDPFETYSALDSLGRCGPAYALIGPETMPSAKRESIGMVKPSGWRISEYDWIDGRYLFNRCHLIAYSLAGENDNPMNLITGTRSMNVLGMLPYEERVASYVRDTGNHVLYRVTPLYDSDNLVASGVLMEAVSVEDGGEGVSFCVWCYNVEPGVVIDYATGDNRAGDPEKELYSDLADGNVADEQVAAEAEGDAETSSDSTMAPDSEVRTYVLNTNTHRFHYPDCPSVTDMKEKNKQIFEGTREEAIEKGYEPCGACKP